MIIRHHDIQLELEDSWLIAAGAVSFAPSLSTYIVDETSNNGRVIALIDIREIAPVRRGCGVSFFNASVEEGLTAEERVIRILRAFVDEVPLPPVELVETPLERHPFRLTNGTHRLYLSLAVGFTHIPAVEGFDPAAFDRNSGDGTSDH